MAEGTRSISRAFQAFMTEAPQHAQAWASAVQGLPAAGNGVTACLPAAIEAFDSE